LKKLGKYTIQSVLGEGAMGIVYKGFDSKIERTVALKTIRKAALNKAERQTLLARFKREAQAAGRLTHPGIVTVYDYDEEGDNAFIAMEYVAGRVLQDYLDKKERFPLNTAIDIVGQLLDVLIYSHAQGVIHRDIKPDNIILLGNGRIKVMDFGIAKIESSTLTQFGDVFGTPSYMSPEQFAGQPVDKRTDLYSTGVILFHLLTGEKPFHGDSIASIMHRVMTTEAPLVSEINCQVPSALDKVVAKALVRKTEKRYQTAAEFKAALTNKSLVGETISAELSGKTRTELREMCAAAGITGVSKHTKQQLIAALQDAGYDGSALPGTNPPATGTAAATQPVEATKVTQVDLGGKYKTVFEPPESPKGGRKKAGPKPFAKLRKRIRLARNLLIVTILALSGITAWEMYRGDHPYREIKEIVIEAKDKPAASFGRYLLIVKDGTVDISVTLFEQLKTRLHKKSAAEDPAPPVPGQETTGAEEKSAVTPAPHPGQDITPGEENPESISPATPEQESTVSEISQSSKHKVKR